MPTVTRAPLAALPPTSLRQRLVPMAPPHPTSPPPSSSTFFLLLPQLATTLLCFLGAPLASDTFFRPNPFHYPNTSSPHHPSPSFPPLLPSRATSLPLPVQMCANVVSYAAGHVLRRDFLPTANQTPPLSFTTFPLAVPSTHASPTLVPHMSPAMRRRRHQSVVALARLSLSPSPYPTYMHNHPQPCPSPNRPNDAPAGEPPLAPTSVDASARCLLHA